MKLIVFGTRPEIIKLYPVIKELNDAYVVCTGQHKELLNVLEDFNIFVDENLNVMKKGQSLTELTIALHKKLEKLYKRLKPSLVIVQGDTTSAMVASLEAYYHKIPVAHIEAGLRTNNIYAPFPEEINRRIITQIARYNFTPTEEASINCMFEGTGFIYETGNTVVDSVNEIAEGLKFKKQKQIILTIHRRENFHKIPDILAQVSLFLEFHPDWVVIMPVHPNPEVEKAISKSSLPVQIMRVKPLGYKEMIKEMQRSMFVVTDSGGIQEEAPSLDCPVLVVRESTERPEGITAGCSKLVQVEDLCWEMENIKYKRVPNPYGDGKAGKRIARFLS